MSRATRYLAGVGIVLGGGVAACLALPRAVQPGAWLAVALCLILQGPLGWWLLRVIGTKRFLLVWGIGLAVRVGVLAVLALAVLPARHWPLGPGLLMYAGVMVSLLFVEGFVALRQQPGA